MVDRDQRLAGGEREALAGEKRDHHAADQSRPGRRRDCVDVANRHVGVIEHLADQTRQDLDMGARRDLRDDPAIGLVRAVLPDHRLRENAPVAGHQRYRTVVARGLKARGSRSFCRGTFA